MSLTDDLTALLSSEQVSIRPADLELASHDESACPPTFPDVVVWPQTTEDVRRVVRYAYEQALALTARGAGSSLEGNPIPVRGGIVADLSRMNRIVTVHAEDLQVTVQPGVVYNDLNEQLKAYGLFFPPSPGGSSDVATIGGMVANNASGIYSVKYGGTRDHVKAATVVTGTGEVLELGTRSRKTSSGYHLLGLLVGSEGTLGIATELTLSLVGLPQGRQQGAFTFPSEKAAVTAIASMMRYGVDLAAVEFLDQRSIAALNRFQDFGLTERPSLFLEVHGSESAVEEVFDTAQSLCEEQRGERIVLPGGRNPWEIRHFTTRAVQALNPHAKTIRTDMGFPSRVSLRSLTRAMRLPSGTAPSCTPLVTPDSAFCTLSCAKTRRTNSAGPVPIGPKMRLWPLSCLLEEPPQASTVLGLAARNMLPRNTVPRLS